MVRVKPIRFLCHSPYVRFEAGAGVNITVAILKFIQFPNKMQNEQNKRGFTLQFDCVVWITYFPFNSQIQKEILDFQIILWNLQKPILSRIKSQFCCVSLLVKSIK